MTRVLALADHSKIGCITQRRFAKVGTKTHPQRGAALDRNGLSVSTETACRFEPKSPVGNSEICSYVANLLGEDEDWLHELSIDMFPEDGRLWVYGVGEDGVTAFTEDGIENLRQIIVDERTNEPPDVRRHRSNPPNSPASAVLTAWKPISPPTAACGSMGSGSLPGHPEMDGPAIAAPRQIGWSSGRP